MGDVTELMWSGVLCAGCGVYIDEHHDDCPRLCPDCEAEEEQSSGDDVVAQIAELKRQLSEKK